MDVCGVLIILSNMKNHPGTYVTCEFIKLSPIIRQDTGVEFNKGMLFKPVSGVKGNQQRVMKHPGCWQQL